KPPRPEDPVFADTWRDIASLPVISQWAAGSSAPPAPPTPAAPVCPNPGNAKPSEWAAETLGFTPSAKQAEVLDVDAKYLILCCNRQWGKTTTIALKALHRALSHNDQTIVIISRTKLQAGILIDRASNFTV